MKCSIALALAAGSAAAIALGAGRQLTGPHAPATTPALSPETAQRKFTLPNGFEIRLFAAEPDVINPVAMTWDDRGRLWVVELYEYPLGAPPGVKPRDRIKILEDTDGDGRADQVKVFADGLNLATGILLGYGGVYVGQAPHLLFLEDTNRDDVADKRTVLMTGFGLQDRHELLNSFTWGPDGWLYMTHGVFTHSKVKDPNRPDDDGVSMDAAVARFQPQRKRLEVFADGTSNPWGVDFDRLGNAFVSACVIDHLFHLVPGGIYVRQGGQPANPHSYQLLPSIVDHRHHMAAYAGVQVYQGNQYPSEYLGTILMGNIHDNAIHQDRLTPNGSSFKASFLRDFVRAQDGWFMPVSTQVGPDGAVWIMDWYDKYPCYQNANADPEGVDREYGRIWRVVYTGHQPGATVPARPPGLNLGKLSSRDLVQRLAHSNIWQRRMAQQLLNERKDPATKPLLIELLTSGKKLETRLAALWTLHSSGLLDDQVLGRFVSDPEPGLRLWVARLTGERGDTSPEAAARLMTLAGDGEPAIGLAVAVALRQWVAGSLTVNTLAEPVIDQAAVGRIVTELAQNSGAAQDPVLPFMIWQAVEPIVAREPQAAFEWFSRHAAFNRALSAVLLRKTMLRVCDLRQSDYLDQALQFLSALPDNESELLTAALDGLIQGQQGRALLPTVPTAPLFSKWNAAANPGIVERAQRLGALWGDTAALRQVLAKATNPQATAAERVKAIQIARQMKNDEAREAMLFLATSKIPEPVAQEAVRALGELGGESVAEALLEKWGRVTPALRTTIAETLVTRPPWGRSFLAAVERNNVSPSEIPATAIRVLAQSKDESIRNRTAKAVGRFRESEPNKLKLISDKRRVVVEGLIDLEAGHQVARKTCFTCHKLHGEGADIGPDLTGVGRSSLDALLANLIDPNQVIGKGYENVEIETTDGRTVSGRMIENTQSRVRLLAAGPKEEIVAKPDIATMRVSELSVMPEGLEQMPEAEFRNLIWFILAPPADNRPLTPERKRELIEGEKGPVWQGRALASP